jgi:uncharacterized membrane protein YfcA
MVSDIALFVAIGFVAQMIDGAMGMAFGVIASSSLIAFGVPPAFASAAVHSAEIATTGVSGGSHLWQRNVDRELLLKLVFAGVAGGVAGAYVLTGLPEEVVRPFVTVYLAAMSALILARSLGWTLWKKPPPRPLVGAGGGFLDAVGGGGWGPLVASTLIASGEQPRRSIGSVNVAEFFVTAAVSATFVTQLDLAGYGRIVLGLIVGGCLAAPLAGYVLRVLPPRVALVLVGLVAAALSVMNVVALL